MPSAFGQWCRFTIISTAFRSHCRFLHGEQIRLNWTCCRVKCIFSYFRFPYADTYLYLFLIAFAYQMIGAFIIANMTVALCSFEFTCFVYLNACIQILSLRLTRIGKDTAESISQEPHGYSKPYEDIVHTVKYHLLVKRYVQSFIKYYNVNHMLCSPILFCPLLSYVKHCEKLTQASIFAEILFSSVIICVTSFKIVTASIH